MVNTFEQVGLLLRVPFMPVVLILKAFDSLLF